MDVNIYFQKAFHLTLLFYSKENIPDLVIGWGKKFKMMCGQEYKLILITHC